MKNILIILPIFLIAQQIASAQQFTSSQLDSLFNKMIRLHNPVDNESPLSDSLSYRENKCGFGLVNSIKENLNLFTAEQQRTLKLLLDRPIKSDSLITPEGFFMIHYNSSGADAPAYDVNELAAALDSSYNFEINYLGFPPPPDDNNAGGDNHYDVYISDISAYGFTTFEFIAARMIAWVRSFVAVMWHGRCRGCSARSPRKEKTGTGSSPCWTSSRA